MNRLLLFFLLGSVLVVTANRKRYYNNNNGYNGNVGLGGSSGYNGAAGLGGSAGYNGGVGLGGSSGYNGAAGFGGNAGYNGAAGGLSGSSVYNEPSASCRYFCKTPKGKYYCCEDESVVPGVVATKPGKCPLPRPTCPRFHFPVKCSNDGSCTGVAKCCWDECLKEHVCKPPEYY